MADPEPFIPVCRVQLNTTWKIVLMAIVLLVVSQILGTLLSVSTFESLLLKTLTTKYEILGKDLKRRIESALKFGKSLDHFAGMDNLIAPVYQLTEDIDEVMIFDDQGALFFSSGRAKPSGPEDASRQGPIRKTFPAHTTKEKTDLPIQSISDFRKTGSSTPLYNGRYYILFPISSALDRQSGILALIFSQSILDRQKEILISSTGKKLLLSLVVTALVMAVMIHLFLTRPSRRLAERLNHDLQDRDAPVRTFSTSGGNSLLVLHDLIAEFQAKTREAEDNLRHALRQWSELNPDHETADAISRMQTALKGQQDEMD
ncbi:MAG: hypothetical protein ABIK15_20975 [Pseudomonadota bacterium]